MQSVIQLSNTAVIVATAKGYLQNTTVARDNLDYGAYDSFDVKNYSTEKIKIRLDGDSTRSFVVNKGEGLATDSRDDIFFNFLVIENQDTVNQIEIGEIQATFIRTQ